MSGNELLRGHQIHFIYYLWDFLEYILKRLKSFCGKTGELFNTRTSKHVLFKWLTLKEICCLSLKKEPTYTKMKQTWKKSFAHWIKTSKSPTNYSLSFLTLLDPTVCVYSLRPVMGGLAGTVKTFWTPCSACLPISTSTVLKKGNIKQGCSNAWS